jgi:ribonuclease D
VPRNQPELISSPEEYQALLAHLRSAGSFAYDSEFIGELTYHPKLCVVQVATSEQVALVDALAGLDLKPFWELVADPALEKVVHAGQQDLEPVFRALDRPPANIFDTQIAAGFVAIAYPAGLSKLVKELVGVSLGKGFTFTHWDQRPLTPVQLRYAADDVRYLPALRAAIGKRLESLGHTPWARQECDALCDASLYHLDPAMDYMRLRGAGSLTPQAAAVLRELYVWRENAAQRNDVPPRSYVKDEILIDMSRKPVKSLADLDRVRGLPRPVEDAEGQNILDATERGLAVPEAQRPVFQPSEESPAERFEIDALWAAVQAFCAGQSVDPAVVCSRGDIARLVRGKKGESEGRLVNGWRRELLGKKLQAFRKGETEIRLGWRSDALRSD